MKLRFTKRAREEFLLVVDVFAEYAGQHYADNFIDKVDKCCQSLLKFPNIGQPEMLLTGRGKTYRAKFINENYRLIYYATKTTVWIVDIWDRRRNPELLSKRINSD